jgi:hypothetical protein
MIAIVPWRVHPTGRIWSLRMKVPSGAIVRCLKLTSAAGASPPGRVLCSRISPVSPSISTIRFDQAKAMLPFSRMLRFALPIQWPDAFRLSR